MNAQRLLEDRRWSVSCCVCCVLGSAASRPRPSSCRHEVCKVLVRKGRFQGHFSYFSATYLNGRQVAQLLPPVRALAHVAAGRWPPRGAARGAAREALSANRLLSWLLTGGPAASHRFSCQNHDKKLRNIIWLLLLCWRRSLIDHNPLRGRSRKAMHRQGACSRAACMHPSPPSPPTQRGFGRSRAA